MPKTAAPLQTDTEIRAGLEDKYPRALKTNAEIAAMFEGRTPNPVTERIMELIREHRAEEKRLAMEAEARGEEWND